MSLEKLSSQVLSIIADVTRHDVSTIFLNQSFDEIENFDSMERLNLFLRVENECHVQFTIEEIMKMETIKALISGIIEKQKISS